MPYHHSGTAGEAEWRVQTMAEEETTNSTQEAGEMAQWLRTLVGPCRGPGFNF